MSYRDPSTRNGRLASEYDLLLALLPLPVVLGVGGAWLSPMPTAAGAALGGVPSGLPLGYALFYRSPVADREPVGNAGPSDGSMRSDD